MAKKDPINTLIEQKIQSEYLEKVMGDCFGSYAKYIIQDRAIPDVRDGLKPVQRRILYAMKTVGMVYGEAYKKSARIVGEVIGKYHPHGDASVYDALVRMSQDFKINVPLIDMQGNKGSIDGDSAAAMRYTEARLSLASMYLLKDIEKKTVQFIPNYDDSEIEPVVLPAKFPNLLVNGAEGISAGYATNIPPHNLNETINLTIERIKNPNLSFEEAITILPGPDFPGGGIIIDSPELQDALKIGRGRVTIRSKTKIEGHNIIVTEIPYGVNKSLLVRKIDTIGSTKKIDGIIEVRDESDKEGLRIVIETRNESNPDIILNYLFKNTDLQINISYNMVAIVDRSPKTLGVLDIIDAYILHTKEVITNRSNYEKDKCEKRLHIVNGLTKLISISDDVIETIKSSNGKQDSKKNIMAKYGFTDLQAEAIVMLQLYRLSKYDVEELLNEKHSLEVEIKRLEHILSNENALKRVIIEELEDINSKVITPRKTVISEEENDLSFKEEELIIHEDTHVIITKDGYIKRLSNKAYQMSINQSEPGLKENDYIIFDELCNTVNTILLFTMNGYYINLPIYKIPELKYKELGAYIGSLFDLGGSDKIVGIYHIDKPLDKGTNVLISTRKGKIKLTPTCEFFEKRYKRGLAMKLQDGDSVVSASLEDKDKEEVVVVTKLGNILKYAKSEVPISGAKALGVKNINLKPKDEVIDSILVPNYYKEEILLLTNRGGLKRILLKNITRTRRSGRSYSFLKSVKTNPYYFLKAVVTNPSKYKDSIELDILTDKELIRFKGTEIPKDNYEHGAPVVQNATPKTLYLRFIDRELYNKYHNDLSKQLKEALEEVQKSHPGSLIDELGEIIEQQTTIFDYLEVKEDDLTDKSQDETAIDLEEIERLKEDLF